MQIYANDGSKMSPHDSQWGYLGCLTVKLLDIIVFEKEKYRDLVMRNSLRIQGVFFAANTACYHQLAQCLGFLMYRVEGGRDI